MSYFDNFDRYMFQRMNDFFRDDYEEPMMITSGDNKQMSAAPRRGVLSAKLDVLEKPNEYLVNVELPGVKKDDIQIHVEKGMLSISAERRDEKKEDKDRYHYSERRYGSIKRVISLPEQADADKVNADFQDGILSLTFAKKPEAAHRKQITIG